MKLKFLLIAAVAAPALLADAVSDIYDGRVRSIEREVLGLAQAMPADKYDFAPTNGTFSGVRTFGLQVRHLATVMYELSASVLGEKSPVEIGKDENGSDALKTKDQIIAYFKDSLAYAHKAMMSITAKNQLDQVPSAFGPGTTTRLDAAAFLGPHTYDHYGQMVVYARMNGVIPGAPPPAAAASGKNKSK